MNNESIEASFLSFFALINFFVFLAISKYSSKISNGALLDNDFVKPQAFHSFPITRSGGIAIIISLLFFSVFIICFIQRSLQLSFCKLFDVFNRFFR